MTKMQISDVLIEIILSLTKKILPLIGCGIHIKNDIDIIASKEFNKVFLYFENKKLCVLSVEGQRDGIDVSMLQNNDNLCDADYYISLDPIDGTLSGALGGSRCLSVVGIAQNRLMHMYKTLPDELSCFYVASNNNYEFMENLCTDGSKIGNLIDEKYNNDIIGTLRRAESEELWKNILKVDTFNPIDGDKTFFLPNAIYKNIFLAGDGSIPLFFECDHFLGRTGVAEARIESRLWKYWRGLIVSGSKMKKYSDGPIKYLCNRIIAAQDKNVDLSEFFEITEIESLKLAGWSKREILDIQTPDMFSPPYETIVIGSITGTKDNLLPFHSKNNLERIIFDERKKRYKMQFYIIKESKKYSCYKFL